MSMADELQIQLPYLRRFARASTDNKQLADDCVERALNTLLNEVELGCQPTGVNVRLYAFQLLESVLESLANECFDKLAWRALILVELEGLSIEQTAFVLRVSSDDIAKLVREESISSHSNPELRADE